MKVNADPDLCQGHARCFMLVPEVFDLDDQGHVVVKLDSVPVELEGVVNEAVLNCPERAISLES